MIRFNEDWLRSPEMCDWLVRVSNDESRAYCRWCAIILRAHKSDLMTHSTTAKHAKNSSLAGGPTGPLNVQIVTSDDPASQVHEDKKQAEMNLRNSLTPRTQYAKKYRLEWEQMDELKDWLQPLPEDPSKAYCRVCNVQLRAHKHDLVLHGKSVKHKTASETVGDNFITVAFGSTIESDGSILMDPHSPPEKKLKSGNDDDTQEIIDTDNSNAMDSSMCEDTEILVGTRPDDECEEKKTGEVNVIRIPANNNRTVMRGSGRKRRMVVSEVLAAIAMNEFTGYELLQIVKAAVPRL